MLRRTSLPSFVFLAGFTLAGFVAPALGGCGTHPSDSPLAVEEPGARAAEPEAGTSTGEGEHTEPRPSSEAGAEVPDASEACVTPRAPAPCPNGLAATFTTQPLSFSVTGSGPMRLDRGGYLHVAFPRANGVTYVTNRSGSFVTESVVQGSADESFLYIRLHVDDCGRPTVLYVKRGASVPGQRAVHTAYVATRRTNGWIAAPIVVPNTPENPNPPTDLASADLALDGAGSPIVVLSRFSDARPTLHRGKPGGGFDVERIPIYNQGAMLPIVVWSRLVGPVIAYGAAGTFVPTIARKIGAEWRVSSVPDGTALDGFTLSDRAPMAVTAEDDGKLHIVYRSALNGRTRSVGYAPFTLSWAGPTATVPLPTTDFVDVMTPLPGGPNPSVSFVQNGDLYVARLTPSGFVHAKIASDVGATATVADGIGRTHALVGNTPSQGTRLLVQACVP